jgi:peptide/nickel transport system permease protein
MTAYLVRRVAHVLGLLCLVLLVVSVLLRLVPGDPVDIMMAGNPGATKADLDKVRQQLGLTAPVYVQVARYVGAVVRGDLGESLRYRSPVRELILERLPATVELTVVSLLLAVAFAAPVGILTALHRESAVDYIGSALAVLGLSTPSFVLGILLILLFAVHWRIFPAVGWGGSLAQGLWAAVRGADPAALGRSVYFLFLPSLSLAASVTAANARMIRSAMLEVLRQDYVRVAQAKGLRGTTIAIKHAFRNALIPIVTILGLQSGYLLGGAFVIENVFAWPGVGRLAVQSLLWRDYPLVQGITLVTAALFLTINLLVDLVYVYVDPRIRLA